MRLWCDSFWDQLYLSNLSYLSETKIYVKLDPKAANTMHTWVTHVENKENTFLTLFCVLSVIIYLFIYLFIEFCSIKPSRFTETKIYVKLDPKAENTAHTWETHIEKKEDIYN